MIYDARAVRRRPTRASRLGGRSGGGVARSRAPHKGEKKAHSRGRPTPAARRAAMEEAEAAFNPYRQYSALVIEAQHVATTPAERAVLYLRADAVAEGSSATTVARLTATLPAPSSLRSMRQRPLPARSPTWRKDA